jgi:hypothetical protein
METSASSATDKKCLSGTDQAGIELKELGSPSDEEPEPNDIENPPI